MKWVPVMALALAAAPSSAFAFECTRAEVTIGPSLLWTERTVPWVAAPGLFEATGDADSGRADVMASFEAWAEPTCTDLRFEFGGVQAVLPGFSENGPNFNVVKFQDARWPYQGGAIAVTTTTYDPRNGRLVDADIEINGVDFNFARLTDSCEEGDGVTDLQNSLTHEVGHLLGLEHPPVLDRYRDVTMFASAPPCETNKRSLAPDDVDGICFIYPTGMPAQYCYAPDGPSFVAVDSDDGFGSGGCRTIPEDGLLWLLFSAIYIALRRRR